MYFTACSSAGNLFDAPNERSLQFLEGVLPSNFSRFNDNE